MSSSDCFKLTKNEINNLNSFKTWMRAKALQQGKAFAKHLHDTWKQFYNSLYQGRNLHMNYTLLAFAAESFCEDMLRVKGYHDIAYADNHKYAAHIFKWLSRMRPIKPINDHVKGLKKEELYSNALFALACAQSFLKCSDFSAEENQYIVYSSMYRDIHAREWSMIFYLLEKSHPEQYKR